jgi:hypothetical protein
MDHLNYKERLEALRRAGFTTLEIERLIQFRHVYSENEMDQARADLSRLEFIRWLVAYGRLTDWPKRACPKAQSKGGLQDV